MNSKTTGAIARVEALGYRSLRYVAQELGEFHVLVGPNSSGKSTFLDVVGFLGDVVRAGLESAIQGDAQLGIPHRAPDGQHLTWLRSQSRLEIAVELKIPEDRKERIKNGHAVRCRYELAIDVAGPLRITGETLWLKPPPEPGSQAQRTLFPDPPCPPETIVHRQKTRTPAGWKKVVSRGEEPERVTFASETSGWNNPFRIAADKTALASLPADEERFPVATWARQVLTEGVQRIVLSTEDMRRSSPPGRSRGYRTDGSNLAHVVKELADAHPARFDEWLRHVREALPDIDRIATREREEDRHRYLVVHYRNGLEAPSWIVSDGTLRLLALTVLAYLDVSGLYLVEEPENGIHPRAVETVFQSLSSVYGAQVLLATHSPVVVSMAKVGQILCFSRTDEGATDVISGERHPRLCNWKGDVDLGTLLASGVLS